MWLLFFIPLLILCYSDREDYSTSSSCRSAWSWVYPFWSWEWCRQNFPREACCYSGDRDFGFWWWWIEDCWSKSGIWCSYRTWYFWGLKWRIYRFVFLFGFFWGPWCRWGLLRWRWGALIIFYRGWVCWLPEGWGYSSWCDYWQLPCGWAIFGWGIYRRVFMLLSRGPHRWCWWLSERRSWFTWEIKGW